jgi:hypothetical protein
VALASVAAPNGAVRAGSPAAGDPSKPGPLAVATLQVPYTVGDRTSQVDVYFAPSGPAGPAVVILPGADAKNHAGHATHLASWGYVAGIVEGAGVVDPTDISPSAASAQAALTALRTAPGLAGHVNNRAAVVGGIFNGLSAMEAATDDPRFNAVVGLHPATFPFGSGDFGALRQPYLAMGGITEGGFLCPYGPWSDPYKGAHAAQQEAFEFGTAHPSDFLSPSPSGGFDFCGAARATPFVWISGLMTAWLNYYLRGDMAAYSWLYTAGGGPTQPVDVTDSLADNAPQQLLALTSGAAGLDAQVSWRQVITDTTALESMEVYRAVANGPFSRVAAVPLASAVYVDPGLTAGTTYHYSAAYRDHAGHLFQTAEPKSLVAGARHRPPAPRQR